MKSAELRERFLRYFKEKGHEIVPSSSLIPVNDPTLLFTNAGMVPFKEVFLGREERSYKRAVSSQRCVRAGGKHNDLENVGYTARHHTFFEMLGNFSFGDYFKREAIQFSWDFLTNELKIPKERLWVTVYTDDDEAADIWLNEIKINPKLFSRCGEKDNFWAMGEIGPCGPCSEIFYDHGPEIPGGPPGSKDQELDRYVEVWNLVFMQYDRQLDGSLIPLPKPSVDTGMGLERLASVMQGVHNNYDTDLFLPLIKATSALAHHRDHNNQSLRVIADHIRSSAFLIADGITPSNEGRGYVLRRIIRRAVRHGHKLEIKEIFFHRLVAPLVNRMGQAFPALKQAQSRIEKALYQEEEQFNRTLDQGLKIVEQEIASLHGHIIPGDVVFRLYDTFGFPVDLTADIAREKELTIDIAGFEEAMEGQREKSKTASQFSTGYHEQIDVQHASEFTGYSGLAVKAQVVALLAEGKNVDKLAQSQIGIVVLDQTPFYAESGGQVGDKGIIAGKNFEFVVKVTKKKDVAYLHYGVMQKGEIKLKDKVIATVDAKARQATVLNHTATHLLHAALRKVLGTHVVQKGSLVEPKRLRFDFSHVEPVKREQLQEIEKLVNEQIRLNITAKVEELPLETAKQKGALALFDEKYAEKVRTLHLGDFSYEICGGTHVQRTGDIGLFKIISETAIASGIRRIEALTGEVALQWIQKNMQSLNDASSLLHVDMNAVTEKLERLLEQNRSLNKDITALKSKIAASKSEDLMAAAKKINDVSVIATTLMHADIKTLRNTLDVLKQKMPAAVIVLAAVTDSKVQLVAGVTKRCTDKIKAGELINFVAQQVGGMGGGRPDMAQAGGTQPENLEAALDSVYNWIKQKLNG